jgi:hypothetical protein
VHTSLAPLYGYSPKGERVRLQVPRNRGKNTTLLASITLLGGMGETMVLEGSTNREVFEAYVERVLAPTLEEAGQLVIMDNLSAHKPARVRELIEGRGCELIYLPAYSPDFNPIEEAFAKIKEIGDTAPSRSPHEGCLGRCTGRSAFGDQRPGRPRLLRACLLSSASPITVKHAVGGRAPPGRRVACA